MAKMKFRATVELDYNQMSELLENVLAIQDTTDEELDERFIMWGNYATYHYEVDKDGNVLVMKVEK